MEEIFAQETMRASVYRGPYDIRLERVAYPVLRDDRDAIVQILAAGICGSDLWGYRGLEKVEPGQVMGHEWIGRVERVAGKVDGLRAGDLVVAPFSFLDGSCNSCRRGLSSVCERGGAWGVGLNVGGGQAQAIRVPFADATLVKLPSAATMDAQLMKRVLPLADVLPTGHFASRCAGIGPGATVLIVGDGAVGLCAVLAARRLGASRVIVAGRHRERLSLAERFGAHQTVIAAGHACDAVLADTGGGVDAALECAGQQEALMLALRSLRKGGKLALVGLPVSNPSLPLSYIFDRNIAVSGGFTPARECISELLPDVLEGRLDASPIFTTEVPLAEVSRGYRLMHERQAIKVFVTVN